MEERPVVEDDRPKRDPSKIINIEQELLRGRKIFLVGPIDDRSAKEICMKLMFLDMESSGTPIFLFINSPGGKVNAGLAIVDTMNALSSPVHTICCGRAFSIAAIILAAGSHGNRICLPYAKVMLHQPSIIQMVATDIMIRAHETLRTKEIMNSLLAKLTKQSEKKISEICERDHYLTATEAVR
ncbi:hypothetical protein GUITHDRAFT_79190 [Guillardia theta CCMP2712]|uniref:ATP-dependent Clp protease proteolytic subunit n=1 Tax=Guillardia theta (strain CCMP2712) TaxID=905079 RepID=L1IJ49_GUITC|nr:hypothetical protein GUITHDRAFT_79190 [Guillardia theta CCMP2712]EKX35944.1 hypothetical protein GUITHDRAFT_79190 [Guillardia theta CCMP2712]|eukprot:XP_005822924.1 hypothetical protein GUITHDRAFT_79190 [Guillardia theta CCMP2712]